MAKGTMAKGNLNGSVDILAKAMRTVFLEAAQEAVKPLRKDVTDVKTGLAEVKGEVAEVKTGLAEVRGELAFARNENQITR